MKLSEVLALPERAIVNHEGNPVIVKWKETTHFQIHEGRGEKDADVFFHSESICFERESGASFTITTCHPSPKVVDMPEFSHAS